MASHEGRGFGEGPELCVGRRLSLPEDGEVPTGPLPPQALLCLPSGDERAGSENEQSFGGMMSPPEPTCPLEAPGAALPPLSLARSPRASTLLLSLTLKGILKFVVTVGCRGD